MAAGDLIDLTKRLPQYEFNGVLYGQAETTGIIVETAEGFEDLPDVKSRDLDRVDSHGSTSYPLLMGPRKANLKISIVNDFGQNVETVVRSVQNTTFAQSAETQMVFARSGYDDKRFFWARCTKRVIVSDYERATGRAQMAMEFTGNDPFLYSLTLKSQTNKVTDGQHGQTVVVAAGGSAETSPIFTLTGPCTNPRIAITSQTPLVDGTRYDTRPTTVGGSSYPYSVIAIDITLAANDVLVIDRRQKTVTVSRGGGAAANAYGTVRSDNRWWNLLPGNNTIQFTESGTAGVGATLKTQWNDAWT